MKCKFCQTEMEDFTESFVICPNEKCPHRDLDGMMDEREGGKTRSYTCKKENE